MRKSIFVKIEDISDFSTCEIIKNKDIFTHVEKFYDGEKKLQSLYVYSKLDDILKEFMSASIDDLYFLESGKPVLKNGFVSISHSGGISLIGCSDYEFGLDIQEIKEINYKVASKLYKDRDVSKITKEEYFLRWTYLEAKAKLNDSSIFDLNEENCYSYSKVITFNNTQYALSIVYREQDITIEM